MRHALLALILSMSALAADFPAPLELPRSEALPDPLLLRDGTRVTSIEQWNNARYPELRALFQQYMYGAWPRPKPGSNARLLHMDRKALGGAATLGEYELSFPCAKQVRLLIVVPNKREGKVPCFLGINFNGNHQALAHPGIALPAGWVKTRRDGTGGNRAREEDRGAESAKWNVETIIQRGYAFATFYHGDIVPDEAALAADRLADFAGPPPPLPKGWIEDRVTAPPATIIAWAWGFSRMLDVLVTNNAIDATRVCAVGHSRNGKTALLAAAMDQRFAMVIPCQAGCGGTAPSRVAPELAKLNERGRPTAETIAVINKAFPHWFADTFKQFNDDPARLPFDQHALIAMCAPRPVLLSNATEDLWANPAGQFEMLKAADPVYKLVAGDGLGAPQMPEVGRLLPSRLGYFIREGKHEVNPTDWAAWLDYADKWLRK